MPTTDEMIDRIGGAAGRAMGRAQVIADRVVPEDERSLIQRVLDLPLRKQLQLARRLWDDPRMGATARASVVAGLAYAVLPIKLSPKALGPLREFEKVVGIGVMLWLLVRLVPRDIVVEHLDALDRPGLWSRLHRRGQRQESEES